MNSGQFRLGADFVSHLLAERHPMIMVDRITDYQTSPHPGLSAERYVSANEPVFTGHFPELKLWPGVHTIEGLRQCCGLLDTLRQLKDADLLDELLALQNHHLLPAHMDEVLRKRILRALKGIGPSRSTVSLHVKLLAPVFAGCVIEYQVRQKKLDAHHWSVQAEVNGKRVAKGEIACQPLDG